MLCILQFLKATVYYKKKKILDLEINVNGTFYDIISEGDQMLS